ncbi:vacuolar membrane protein-related, putative [Plasmodium sp. gorilla clade G2]|uniref:vacuolar membrane protein-related, putative n=1 Tax=Plasmodium sp. gorilla clade G2 TaxID=880535 RepID=UPI000D229A79|nr:vacuolar membrane protein-related, putative [Plasmodium sp. gorilla clade G2]SOV15712.1 vacuolar membrane protein-related, putative [Plasmodium sp. gorilla clade G2]
MVRIAKNRIKGCFVITKCFYTNNSKCWNKEYVYTKYRICMPNIDDVKYDDLYLSCPNRDDLYIYTKKVPIFLRYLKLITSLENRNNDFIMFTKKCENGLNVEKDVYLTKEELLDTMFINGYSEKEMNALDLSFCDDYNFHYPEISVLFNLDEEDVYKYCLKKRSENPDKLIHLKYVKEKNMLSSYGLIFVFLYFGLNNLVLSNAWFLSKTIPFFSVFYMLGSYFYKDIQKYLNKDKNLMILQNHKNKLLAEDIIYKQLKLFSKDTQCIQYLINFKKYSNILLNKYIHTYLNIQKKKVVDTLEKKLKEIYINEQNYKNSLQNILINEIIKKLYQNIKTDKKFADSILNDSINNIKNINKNDTLINYIKSQLQDIQKMDHKNHIVQNILQQYENQKQQYLSQYFINTQELNQIKHFIHKSKLDLNNLNHNEYNDLIHLFNKINNKFGFYVNHDTIPTLTSSHSEYQPFIQQINKLIENTNKAFQHKNILAFLKEFQNI